MGAPQGIHIGTLVKPHGIRGEMVIKGSPLVLEKLEEGMPLFIAIDGQRVPFFIEEISLDDSGGRGTIRLEFIQTIEDTRRYITCEVYSDPAYISGSGSELKLADYKGFTIVDKKRGAGKVVDYVESSENPLLIAVIDGNEVMIPLFADYLLGVDRDQKKITVDIPEGLS